MNDEYSQMAADAICHAAGRAQNMIGEAMYCMTVPSVLYRPRVFMDGNKWCALYGENLQDGCAGFGDTIAAAMTDFDRAWKEPIRTGCAGGSRNEQ